MDCICYIINKCFTYDWFRDIWIPLLGAVLIPALIWYLTWYYGADKAEQRKELRQLRNNLNLLLSICLDTLNKLIALRTTIVKNHIIEQDKNIDPFSEEASSLTSVYTLPTKMDILNVSNYSACIPYSENYVLMLLNAISAVNIVNFKLERRNFYASFIDPRENIDKRVQCFQTLVNYDLQEYDGFLECIDKDILLFKYFIEETKALENKYKGLSLDTIKYSEDELVLFTELENHLKSKETTDDK